MFHHNTYVQSKVNMLELLSLLTERFKSRIKLPFSLCIPHTGYDLAAESTWKYKRIPFADNQAVTIQAPFLSTDPLGYKQTTFGICLDSDDLQKDTQVLFEEIYQFVCKATDDEFSTQEYQRFKESKV